MVGYRVEKGVDARPKQRLAQGVAVAIAVISATERKAQVAQSLEF